MDTADLARLWWTRLAERCVAPDGAVRAARGRRRALPLWPVTQVLHAGILVEPMMPEAELPAHRRRVDAIVAGLQRYRSGEAWGPFGGQRPRYADDVAWLGLALTDLARQRSVPLPDDAVRAARFVRACEHPEGGVRWHEATESRNTCATAPGVHLVLRAEALAGAPAREPVGAEALAFARRTMTWLETTLLRDDHLYADAIEDGRVEQTVWAYNQGEAAAAWRALAAAGGEGDAGAGAAARRTSRAAIAWLAGEDVAWRQPPVFMGITARDLLRIDDPEAATARGDLFAGYLHRVTRQAFAGDGFPTTGIGHYDQDPAIDLAGLVQVAAAYATPREGRRGPPQG